MLVRLYMILLGFLSERYLLEPDVTLKDLINIFLSGKISKLIRTKKNYIRLLPGNFTKKGPILKNKLIIIINFF